MKLDRPIRQLGVGIAVARQVANNNPEMIAEIAEMVCGQNAMVEAAKNCELRVDCKDCHLWIAAARKEVERAKLEAVPE
jgi:hypothetical protein